MSGDAWQTETISVNVFAGTAGVPLRFAIDLDQCQTLLRARCGRDTGGPSEKVELESANLDRHQNVQLIT